jgi:hypothetical protein
VPPVIAVTFFERRYNNDPLILQYAHRVLKQHPVHLTFFFVPQVVQALRYDNFGGYKYGYHYGKYTWLISGCPRLCRTFHL